MTLHITSQLHVIREMEFVFGVFSYWPIVSRFVRND